MEDNRAAKRSTETWTQDRLNGALQEFTYTRTAMVAFFLLSQNASGVSLKPFKHVECISVLTFATVFVLDLALKDLSFETRKKNPKTPQSDVVIEFLCKLFQIARLVNLF